MAENGCACDSGQRRSGDQTVQHQRKCAAAAQVACELSFEKPFAFASALGVDDASRSRATPLRIARASTAGQRISFV